MTIELGLQSLSNSAGLPKNSEQLMQVILDALVCAKIIPPEVEISAVHNFVQVMKQRRKSLAAYRPQPYPGKVLLISLPSVPTEFPGAAHDATRGWGELVGGGVQVIFVSGDHANITRPPHVQAVAEIIKHACREAVGACTIADGSSNVKHA